MEDRAGERALDGVAAFLPRGEILEVRTPEGDLSKRIDSLTRNLLECYEELDLIYRLSRRGLSALDTQDSVATILCEAMEIFEADMGWLTAQGAEPAFRPVMAGVSPETALAVERAMGGRLADGGKSKLFYHLKEELGLDMDGAPDAFLSTALETENAVYGALCVGRWDGKDAFTAGDMKLAEVLASQAAIGLENTILHRRRMEEREATVRLQEEFRLARTIQDRLLPKGMPVLNGYDIAGRSFPAHSVGGDYFDFIPVDHGKLALCLGDVSGKGMPAALLMAYLQAAIRGQTLLRASPGECLNRSNRLLYHSTDVDRFATCFYGLLDAEQHCLRYANAGHDRPLLLSSSGDPKSLDSAGLVLGILEETGYEEVSVPFAPGDALIVYSDGIIDAADHDDLEFGTDRLWEVLRAHRGKPALELLDRVVEEVGRHAGEAPQTDDMTLMVLRRLP